MVVSVDVVVPVEYVQYTPAKDETGGARVRRSIPNAPKQRLVCNVSLHIQGSGGSVVQCSARDLKVASSILVHGSFLVRRAALSH